MSLCAHVTGNCFQSRKYEQLFPVVWGLPYLWTIQGTCEWPAILILWKMSFPLSQYLLVSEEKISQEKKKDIIRTSTTHSDQSQSRVLVEKVNEFMKCQKKVCFVFWLTSNSDWSIRDRDVLGIVLLDTLLWIQKTNRQHFVKINLKTSGRWTWEQNEWKILTAERDISALHPPKSALCATGHIGHYCVWFFHYML